MRESSSRPSLKNGSSSGDCKEASPGVHPAHRHSPSGHLRLKPPPLTGSLVPTGTDGRRVAVPHARGTSGLHEQAAGLLHLMIKTLTSSGFLSTSMVTSSP